MKLPKKLALSAAMFAICSSVSASAEPMSSHGAVNVEKADAAKNSLISDGKIASSPEKVEKKNAKSGSKKSLLGMVSLLFVSII